MREKSELFEQVKHVLRVLGAPVDLVGARRDLFFRDPPYEFLNLSLVVV